MKAKTNFSPKFCATIVGFCLAPLLTPATSFSPRRELSSRLCEDLRETRLRLGVHGKNLLNIETTRTPKGGPYQPYRVSSCRDGDCEVVRDALPILKFLPQHPDADTEGFVAFPNIHLRQERSLFNAAALKLQLLAQAGACNVQLLNSPKKDAILLTYTPEEAGPELTVREDILNFAEDHSVRSWQRVHVNGTVVANFHF